jgi:Fe-S cluster biogenesis protein NfuA
MYYGENIDMEEKIERALEELRPYIAQHLGGVEFAGFADGVVSVRMHGACTHCPLSQVTLKAGVEALLKERVPEVRSVEAV